MIGTFGETPVFDSWFYISQVATMLLWLVAMGTVRWQRRWHGSRGAALWFAIATELVLPAAWSLTVPSTGLDVLRLVPAAAGTVFESALSCLWAVRAAADRVVPRGQWVRPFVVAALASLAMWVVRTALLLLG